MSIKMSEAAVKVTDIIEENQIDNTAAKKQQFKVITVNDMVNPFTFDDEELTEKEISSSQKKQMFILLIATIVTFALISLVQSSLHSARVDKLISTSPTESITVKNGDSLWSIAEHYAHNKMNLSEFVYHISSMNELNTSRLYVGQQLIVPSL